MMTFLSIDKQWELISRGAEEIIPKEELKKKLEKSKVSGTPLNIKLGCDPSRPDLHVGHGVVLRKLRHFQDLGHQAILVIGDFTAMIGDPSGRNKTRPQLTLEEAKANAESYIEQAGHILDSESIKIVYNSTWLNKMLFSDVIRLSSHYTVARMLERDDFTKRYQSEIPISIHEFMYPLAQGMDSVELKADVELGGTDQKFNLLVGRDLQREYNQAPQAIITLPLLEGTDGVEKMSKSYGNDIGLTDSPEDMYGKSMSISDEMIEKYFILAADADTETVLKVHQQLEDPSINPRDIKRELARAIVALYHGNDAALSAEQYFDRVVVNKDIPDEMDEVVLKEDELLIEIITAEGLTKSKGDARRMLKQGAVRVEGEKISDMNHMLFKRKEVVIKVGKRRFLRV
ncbi:MAG: tyrosine--tRNA ligase, partial [Candidatus Marinimicrobia bacterium]|nr:tyrosine--tRNA ligase [Candidatus Neomarinimicrobiota bacterium]MBT3763208.1 tyrosine--tRNA ligase [Candidatus Neomarinimicrobiota bacterium]MBT4068616.1 tyrosine--tRNA ligase [Candidatus Neomarinimicrobiota bacterium]MBT4270649.1 tyrosine--tRNA ligase [Candidatus Neomarinimicrobiota bacterium]MBT4372845.1 tyrosine--tRNA ligase [Candidatus Neomarinimicrobiota bacterium]